MPSRAAGPRGRALSPAESSLAARAHTLTAAAVRAGRGGTGLQTEAEAETEASELGGAAALHPVSTQKTFDFARIRIHTGEAADRAARAESARAFARGNDVFFAEGQLDLATAPGRTLFAHELVHVAQHGNQPGGLQPEVRRQSWSDDVAAAYDKKKWAVYHAMIEGMQSAKRAAIGAARAGLPHLPEWARGSAGTLLDVADFTADMIFALCLVLIGLAVGFVQGIAGLISGLAKLAAGLVKITVDLIAAAVGKGESFKQDLDDIATAAKNLLPGLKARIEALKERYMKASPEDQVLIGGEMIGEIEAFLATFAFAGAKGGQVGSIAVPTVKLSTKVVALEVGEVATAVTVPQVAIATTQVAVKPLAEAGVIAMQASALGGPPGHGVATAARGGATGRKAFQKPLTPEEIDQAVKPIDPARNPALKGGGPAPRTTKAAAAAAKAAQLDLTGVIQRAMQLLKARKVTGLPPHLYGTKLHAAVREVIEAEGGGAADWEVIAERRLGDSVALRPESARLTVGQYIKRNGLTGQYPALREDFLNTALAETKPDLLVRAPNGQKLLWDLTSQLEAEHLAKTMFYGQVAGLEEGGMVRISEDYWRTISGK